MLHSFSLLSLSSLLLTTLTAASPSSGGGGTIGSLPVARSFNFTRFGNIVAADQARASVIRRVGFAYNASSHFANNQRRQHAKRAVVSSFPITNAAVVYTANIGIGNPPNQYTLLIDTGSANTWVGANPENPYIPTSSSFPTLQPVSVTYGSGSFTGLEWYDQVTLDSSLVVRKQSIGQALESQGFNGYDGILGIGPTDLTQGTVLLAGSVPTVTDNLAAEKTISHSEVGVFFAPTTSVSDTNGELTFGGTDPSKYQGEISYAPITNTYPASAYWGIDAQITYGSSNVLGQTAGIVDTGTSLVLIASDAFATYQSLTGATADQTTGLLMITPAQYNNLQTLNFVVNGVTFGLTPNGQIWPRALNTAIGGNPNMIYLIVNNLGSPSGSGLDFIAGYTFLERFYSVFDTRESRVGFAPTAFTTATTN
jgi:hypothetical protein